MRQWEGCPVRSPQDGLILLNGTAALQAVGAMGTLSGLWRPANGCPSGETGSEQAEEQTESRQIVLEIAADGSYTINRRAVPEDQLLQRLTEIYSARPDKVLFVKADGDLVYQDVIEAYDLARGAGVKVIGTIFADAGTARAEAPAPAPAAPGT